MNNKNITRISEIHLLGFQTPENKRVLIFFLFLSIYFVAICGNLLIIILVAYSKSLHFPMYFFLCQLSGSDILLVTDILSNILRTLLAKEVVISFSDCIAQFYFFDVSETLECLLLTVMCYDRYLAVCKPLHYVVLMSHHFCWMMVTMCWTFSISIVLIHTLTISQLQFCGPNIIDHFFCDLEPILALSCSDTTIVQLEVTLLSTVFVVIPFIIILVSYVYIIITILKIPTISGRKKVFSTCSAHLTVVCMYYGTLVCVYLIPRTGKSQKISKFLSLLYTVATPLLNPVIYSLRNEDLTKVVKKILNTFCTSLILRTDTIKHLDCT
ncbi:olfactory receptor 1M1-like [Hyperolius riggenbachi]|uniref:olfactory receptor 1M1-like n=1 Tax=Hyperolius riggenbachi TaxID=752182 RepID=UPI0035A366EF